MPGAGLEPACPLQAADFLTTITFVTVTVCGLDYTFNIAFALVARRLVSTPSLAGLARYWHFTAFTEFDGFYSIRFRIGTQFSLSPLRLPISPSGHYFFLFLLSYALNV